MITERVENLSLLPKVKDRLDDRSFLLNAFDGLRRDIDQSRMMESMDKYNREAVSLLTNSKARNAFNLSEESPQLRDKYGRHKWGQRALLARRLVEAGTSFVTMQMQSDTWSVERMPCFNTHSRTSPRLERLT